MLKIALKSLKKNQQENSLKIRRELINLIFYYENNFNLDKMGKKIIDNVEITIKNMHFRFENTTSLGAFSWGITL